MRYLIYLSFIFSLLSLTVHASTIFTVDDMVKEKRQDVILNIVGGTADFFLDIEGEFHVDSKEQLRIYTYRNSKSQGIIHSYAYNPKEKLARKRIKITNTPQIKVSFLHNVGKKRPHPIVVRIYQIPPLERLHAISTPLKEQINAILSQGAKEVAKNIEGNIVRFNNLQQYKKNLNKQQQQNKTVRREVADALSNLSASYKDASDIKKQIKAKNKTALANIADYTEKTQKELHKIQQEVESMGNEINFLVSNPINSGFDAESRQRLKVTAKKRILKSLEAQSEGWEKFYNAQQQLQPLLEKHTRKVDLLLEILAMYADVYLQLSYAVELGQNIGNALHVLDDATELETVLQSLDSNLTEINKVRKQFDDLQF